MPITEQEKLGVHARPFSDSLVAVPFKKRKFLFTRPPSPPPQLLSSTPENCDNQCKPESSEANSPLSETCSRLGKTDAVTGNESAVTGKEVRSASVAPNGLCPYAGVASINFASTEQERILDNQILPVMETMQFPLVMQETSEKPHKVKSDSSQIVQSEGISVLYNKILPVIGSAQPPSRMQETSEVPQETSEVLQKVRSDDSQIVQSEGIPVLNNKILPVIGSVQPPSTMQETSEVPQETSEVLPQKVGSDGCQIVQGEGISVLNYEILPVIGSMQPPSTMQETSEVPQKLGSDECLLVQSDGISVKEDDMVDRTLLSKSSDDEFKVDSGHLSLSRSNWDLNTTMDTWEGSKTDFALNHGTYTSGRIELDDMHKKRLDLHIEPNRANATLGNCNFQTNDRDHKLLNQSTGMVEYSDSGACLDLELKPSFLSSVCTMLAEQPNLKSLKEMPSLSSSVKPTAMTSSHNPQSIINRLVKSEASESGHGDIRKADEIGETSFLVLRHVKSEPCEGHGALKTLVSGDLKSACSIDVKTEPLDQLEGSYKSPEGRPLSLELGGHGLSLQSTGKFDGKSPDLTYKSPEFKSLGGRPFQTDLGAHDLSMQSTEVHPNACKFEGNILELTSKSTGSVEGKLISDSEDPSSHVSKVANNVVDKAPSVNSPAPTPSNEFPIDTDVPKVEKETITTPSGMIMRPMILDSDELNSKEEKCKTDNLPIVPETSALDCRVAADCLRESVPEVDSFDARNSSEVTRIDEFTGQYKDSNDVESGGMKEKTDISPQILDNRCEIESKDVVAYDAAGTTKELRKQCGTDDEDYEDGEVGDLALISAVVGLCEKREVEQVRGIDSVSSLDVPVLKPSVVEEKEISINNLLEVKDYGTVECDIGPCDNKYEHGSLSVGVLTAESTKSGPIKSIRKISNDHIKKNKVPERKMESDIGVSTSTVIKDYQVDANTQQEEAEGSDLLPKISELSKTGVSQASELCKTKSSQADCEPKDVIVAGQHSRIIYLNTASNGSTSEKIKSESGRLSSPQIDKERLVDRSFNQERSQSRGCRDEYSSENSRKFDVGRSQFHQVGKHVKDFVRNRNSRTDERQIALHGENHNSNELPEHINSMTRIQFPRRLNDSEMSIAGTSNGSNCKRWRHTNDELQNLSRMPCRGRSPGDQGQLIVVRHPIREISPGRRIGRDLHDFVLTHEENLMRNMPDGMREPPSLARSQYEGDEGFFVRRERRSLSPTQQRGALHLPANCSKSSSRAQQRVPQQWTTPGRCPDDYTEPQGPVRCRSPQMIRRNRLRSPLHRPCYQEEMVHRRRVSPPYIDRLSDDVIGMVPPARERNFLRPVRGRGSDRNIRRFNLVDPREATEEDYFGPPFPRNEIREFFEDDEYADDRRRCEERQEPIRSFRQRAVDADDDDDNFPFHVENGPSRTFRLCPENNNERFPGGSARTGFNGRFRNRLGNTSGRLIGTEQEQDENYRHHEGQGWRDDSYGDVRLKRRRF